ncbi:uncharacterized protein LOC124169231 [Ischnura elegans]|uniref:uncharacterized protein LOC124169231 n=1 Tax=Ischnura elegans TaxID=197161 RepID=UPI001ED88658|nr:uncharacterized protein LOC124169231 [Ischnura elegans]
MINGKVCNAFTGNPNMRCYICGATAAEMNNLMALRNRPVDVTKYSFGLSTLHCYIRFFECLLHIPYRLEFRKWQARGNLKTLLTQRKIRIQKAFKERMGLIVDVPRPGSGNTNDGNSARRFFDSPELAADLTGINVDLIKTFSIILRAVSSGVTLNYIAFSDYCQRTAELYIKLYPWYYMPTTVHKVLLHGSEIAKEAILPLGQVSEEALEARNKDTRTFRMRFSRKHSRKATNEDLFKRLLLTSDPFLSSTLTSTLRRPKEMPKDLRDLLILDDVEEEGSDISADSSFGD